MKHTSRSGSLWERVDRIQTQMDMRKTVLRPDPKTHGDLLNSFRL